MNDSARWTPLARALAFGAAFDGLFAVAILALTRPAAALLRIELPADPIYLYLCGVLLFILAGVYAAAARDPGRYAAVVPVSAAGRGAGTTGVLRVRSTVRFIVLSSTSVTVR